jgi:hypothetical protein
MGDNPAHGSDRRDVTDGYHPRALAIVGLLGPAVRRASIVGMVAGVLAGIAWPIVLRSGAHPLAVVAGSAVLTPAVALAVALIVLPRDLARAYESFSWLGHREARRFVARTGSRVPVGVGPIREWLEANPVSPATADARVELLVALGRFDEARAEHVRLAPPATAEDRLLRAALRTWWEIVETGDLDIEAFDAVAATLPAGSPLRLEADVTRAVAAARLRAVRGEAAPLEPLQAVRPALGREPAAIVLRDTWLPFLRQALVIGSLLGVVHAASLIL